MKQNAQQLSDQIQTEWNRQHGEEKDFKKDVQAVMVLTFYGEDDFNEKFVGTTEIERLLGAFDILTDQYITKVMKGELKEVA